MRQILVVFATLSLFVAVACESGGGGDSAPEPGGASPAPTAQGTNRPPSAATPAGSLDWTVCEGEFECATLEVPLDYEDPAASTIELSLLRFAARDPDRYLGPLIVNPGGPGSSGVAFAMEAESYFPREIIDRFDIIGFDPRGVGESEPIDCGDDVDFSTLDYTPEDDGERAHLEDIGEDYAADCQQQNGVVLQHLGTVNVAADIEQIRMALGAEQLSYFGYSYGTLIGAMYAELYPDRVRAMVLDSAVDPAQPYDERIRQGSIATEEVFADFLADCGARRACDFYSGGDPAGTYDRLVARLEGEPIPAVYYEDEKATSDDVRYAVLNGLYDQSSWLRLAYALMKADRDEDGTSILDLAYPPSEDEEDTNFGDANAAINCVDSTWPDDPQAFHDLAAELSESAPRVGAEGAYYELACAYWRYEGSDLPAIDAAGSAPILVIGATGDAITPYRWSQALAEQLDAGVLLTYEGYVHAVAYGAVSECVDEAALLYLVELTPPAPGTTCTD